MMKHLFMTPMDVWLFRNGKPFNAGSDHRAETIFPPLPTVLQGAIRTHYIEQHGGITAYLAGKLTHLHNKVGKKGEPPPEAFQLQGGFLARYEDDNLTCYAPLPAHAYLDGETYRLLEPKQETGVITDLGQSQWLLWRDPNVEPTKDSGGWLSLADLKRLLNEQELPKRREDTLTVKPDSHFFERESRLGIQLDYQTRTTETGKLYQAEFIRLKDGYGLYVGLEGLDWLDKGVLNLGGESHTAIYEIISEPSLPTMPTRAHNFTVAFLTPTYFEKGWQPDDWSKFVGNSARFVAAAVGKPLVLGGFDLANKRHKASRRYMPAGSTYYFKGTANITSPTICDELTENKQTFNYGQYGFGQYILGEW